ncbi:transposase domain-containing protein [Streptomyces noursei]|uniref:transposase domain-containing protein n=1 Tax=Streptomyces noursei TaxID=1971 RepID=UPI0011AF9FD1|nr:transposase domain-containing protein [Streptomyces noursei]
MSSKRCWPRTGAASSGAEGKLPPHVRVYFAMAMALYAAADYEEIITELSDGLDRLGCWGSGWEIPGSGAITRARQRLGDAVRADLLDAVAQPVAELLTPEPS